MLKVTPEGQLTSKAKALRDKYKSYLTDKLSNESDSESKIKEELKQFVNYYKQRREMYRGMSGGRKVLNDVLRMKITDETGLRYDSNSLINTKIGKVKILGNVNEKVLSPEYKKTLNAYSETLEPNQKENLRANLTKIKRTITLSRKKTKRNVKTKTITADIGKYLGSTDLSKDDVRESIYDFWETTSKKYGAFEDALKKVLSLAKTEDLGIPQGPLEEKDTGGYFYTQIENPFREKMAEIERKYGNLNLEYIYDFTKMKVPYTEDPKMRLVEALDRIIISNRLIVNEQRLIQEYGDDESTEGAQEKWQESMIDEIENKIEASKREQSGVDSIADTKFSTADDSAIANFSADIASAIVDPLLSFELVRGKKLLALDTDSQRMLRETIKAFKDEETDLDTKTNLNELFSEVRDTLIMEKDKYVLPISVLENADFEKFAKTDGLVSANKKVSYNETIAGLGEKGSSISRPRAVIQTIYDLFDDLHSAMSKKQFGFAGGVRSTGRGGTLGGALPPRSDARNTPIQRLVEEPKRQVPVNIQSKGKLREGTKKFLDAIKELLEAFDDYYVSPLYAGKLPIEAPSFMRSSGVKSLTVYLREMGGITVKGSLYEKLSTTGRATISATTLKDIADFLVKFKSPNIKLTESLIDQAEECAIGLTELFNNEEMNRNYCAAVLVHFMEETGDDTLIGEDFLGKTIKSRNNTFKTAYENNKAIPAFALPYFLDQHQSLLTKDAARKKQYNRLVSVVKEVEDDLPIHIVKLLKAHDGIRKAIGKKAVYGFLPRNFEGYEIMVSDMYKTDQIDLSHLEVDNIVKSDNAHSNISKEYGITEEQVYLIKANFR